MSPMDLHANFPVPHPAANKIFVVDPLSVNITRKADHGLGHINR